MKEQLIDIEHNFIFSEEEFLCHRLWIQTIIVLCISSSIYLRRIQFNQHTKLTFSKLFQIYSLFTSTAYYALFLALNIRIVIWVSNHGFDLHEMMCSENFHIFDGMQRLYWINYVLEILQLLTIPFSIVTDRKLYIHNTFYQIIGLMLSWGQLKYYITMQWAYVWLRSGMNMIYFWHMSHSAEVVRITKRSKLLKCLKTAPLYLETVVRIYGILTIFESLESGAKCHGNIGGIVWSAIITFIQYGMTLRSNIPGLIK